MNTRTRGRAIEDELQALRASGGLRSLREVERAHGCRVRVDGREAVSFGSCDYLGLATDTRLAERAAVAAREHGAGAGAARLLTGHGALVDALERELAAAFGVESALVFGAGYLANVGVVTALCGRGDLVVSDRLSHASTVDACRLSRAEVRVVEHGDLDALRASLADAEAFGRALVLVEGLYSMDGDVAPLADVVDIAHAAGAWVAVDDAHGFGTLGPGGRGAAAAAGVADRVDVQCGNLGKALGSYGAFVLARRVVREWLVQRARSFVFTCALPPAVVEAARAGVEVLVSDPEPLRRLRANVERLRARLAARGARVPGVATPIVPVVVGDAERALAASAALLERGFLVPAIRPPTVPEGSSRLRLTVTAAHEPEDLDGVADALADVLAR